MTLLDRVIAGTFVLAGVGAIAAISLTIIQAIQEVTL